MITKNNMLYLYVETPLHAGTGSGLSSIDLPIQRERTTQYPMIQGSGIKGKLRSIAEEAARNNKEKISEDDVTAMFGPATAKASPNEANGATSGANNAASSNDYAGALIAGDARILLFPVRSVNGVFAYTTSYDVLNRFKRDIERGRSKPITAWQVPSPIERDSITLALVTTNSDVQMNNSLVLEEFSFETQASTQVDEIAKWIAQNALPDLQTGDYWANKLTRSLVILPDDDFRDFALYATEVITRVRISRETKTVESGALWTEEHLPTDTLMYVPMYATNTRKKGNMTMTAEQVLNKMTTVTTLGNNYLQLGGDETVGRGLVRIRWSE